MNTTMNKGITDVDLQNDILSELKYEPSVKTSDIGVTVHGGAVTLTGFTTSYWEKACALRAVKRVAGVDAIADEMQVKLPGSLGKTDGEIAATALQQMKWAPSVPEDGIQCNVRDGWITLEGSVEWWYQKDSAENAVQYIAGVKGVTNNISIRPTLSATSIKHDIEASFKRSSMLDANDVTVGTSGSTVTLSGEVRTYAEKEEAGRTAWAAAGVMSVDNNLKVDWSWLSN